MQQTLRQNHFKMWMIISLLICTNNCHYSVACHYIVKLQQHNVKDYSSACLQQCQNSSVKQFGVKLFSWVLEKLSGSKKLQPHHKRTKQTGYIFTNQMIFFHREIRATLNDHSERSVDLLNHFLRHLRARAAHASIKQSRINKWQHWWMSSSFQSITLMTKCVNI